MRRLRESQARLDALRLPPIADEEVEEAVQASRRERRGQDNATDDAAAAPRQRP